jgi:mRNA interferase RelE/StbE
LKYSIEFKKSALKDLEKINKKDALKILFRIEKMEDSLSGDIKKLTNYTPEYRLRVGNYRILFEIAGNEIIIYCVKHRKDLYN